MKSNQHSLKTLHNKKTINTQGRNSRYARKVASGKQMYGPGCCGHKLKIANLRNVDTDCRVFFRRPDNSIYAIIGPTQMLRLRRSHQLNLFLKQQRESGVVFRIAKA